MNFCGGKRPKLYYSTQFFMAKRSKAHLLLLFLSYKLLDLDPFAMTILKHVCALGIVPIMIDYY